MLIIDCEQQSEDWLNMRRGVITASRAHSLLTPAKRRVLAKELLAEKLSNEEIEPISTRAMEWGIENEKNARARYELEKQISVSEVGFCLHEDFPFIGCSPDGLVGVDGLIEIKCPSTKNHIEYLQDGPPTNYVAQMQLQMAVTGRDWVDFVSYDPRIPWEAQLYVHRVISDQAYIENLIDGAKWVEDYIQQFIVNHIKE